MSSATLESSELGDKVVLPGDPRFDEARVAWNLFLDQRPEAVVHVEDATDVQAASPWPSSAAGA